MHFLDIDWCVLAERARVWPELDARTRHALLAAKPGEPVWRGDLGRDYERLVAGGFLLAGERGLDAPVLTGTTAQRTRERLYADFRAGRLPALAVSKVANFAIDLPDAALMVQLSGTFGSRQEEAQRLGRLLRPKGGANQAHFYTLVSRDTVEQDFALHRQLFLCEQGYEYRIVEAEELAE